MKIDHGGAVGIVLTFVDTGHGGADHSYIRLGQLGPIPWRKSQIEKQTIPRLAFGAPSRPGCLISPARKVFGNDVTDLTIGANDKNREQ